MRLQVERVTITPEYTPRSCKRLAKATPIIVPVLAQSWQTSSARRCGLYQLLKLRLLEVAAVHRPDYYHQEQHAQSKREDVIRTRKYRCRAKARSFLRESARQIRTITRMASRKPIHRHQIPFRPQFIPPIHQKPHIPP